MDKAKKYLIVVLTAICPLFGNSQELTFREYDEQSLVLYNESAWKELIKLSEEAIRDSIDYYYLRIRTGIACYEIERYEKAIVHLTQSLAFYENDPVALEYLYGCYLELNKPYEARKTYNLLPQSIRDKLKRTLPGNNDLSAGFGPVLSNQMEKFSAIDLDGQDDIYGETDIVQDGYYLDFGYGRALGKGSGIFAGYSLIKLNMNKLVSIGDSLSVDDQYPLFQHQFYLSGNINLGKGFYITPAVNVIFDRYEKVMPHFAEDSLSYVFPLEKFSPLSFIAYLSLKKDFHIVQAGLFGAYSNLNEKNQFQAGFQALVFPYGNLDLYFDTRLLNHHNDGKNNIIFEEKAGIRLFKPMWAEVNATFGRMENYYDKQAYVVYNIIDRIRFKTGAKAIIVLNPKMTLTAEYIFMAREGKYLSYNQTNNDKVVPVTKYRDFEYQVYLLTLHVKI